MAIEIELKFAAEESAFEGLLAESSEWTRYEMATTYYGDPDGKLSSLRWTLRRRFENGVSVCTVKTPHTGLGRNEFEVECGDIMEAIPQLVAMGAPEELTRFAESGLEETCAARFTRQAIAVTLPGAEAELALDEGVFLGGGQTEPFAEVEVEHKSGSEALVAAWAAALAERYHLEPEARSKAQRARALAGRD